MATNTFLQSTLESNPSTLHCGFSFSEIGNEQAWALVGMSREENEGNGYLDNDIIALDENPLWSGMIYDALNSIRAIASPEGRYDALLALGAHMFTGGRVTAQVEQLSVGEPNWLPRPLTQVYAALTTEDRVKQLCDNDAIGMGSSVVWECFMRQALEAIVRQSSIEGQEIAILSFAAQCFASGRYAGGSREEWPSKVLMRTIQ